MSNKRNIINEAQIQSLIEEYSKKYPNLVEFIHSALRNFLFKKAPSQEHPFYFLNHLKRKKTKQLKQILKNGGPFHEILMNSSLIQRIDNAINFIEQHPEILNNKKMGFEGIELAHSNWIKSLNKRIKTVEGEVDLVYSFSDGKTIVKLIDEQSYQREGSLMKHCVAAYSSRKNIDIYSLRNVDNEPVVTFEVQDKIVKQISEKCNQEIKKENKKYINEFALVNKYKFNFVKNATNISGIYSLLMKIFLAFNWKVVIYLGMPEMKISGFFLKNAVISQAIDLCMLIMAGIAFYEFVTNFTMGSMVSTDRDQI